MDSNTQSELHQHITETIELLNNERYSLRRLFRDFEIPSNPVNRKDKTAIVTAICRSMKQHLRIEAEILYPAVRRIVPGSRSLNYSIVETSTLEYMIAVIESMSRKDPLFSATVEVFGEYVLQHFRSQEENLMAETQEVCLDATSGSQEDKIPGPARTERQSV